MATEQQKRKAAAQTGNSLLIVVAIVVVANLLSAGAYTRFDSTKTKRFTLSEGSGRLVRSLKEPIHVKKGTKFHVDAVFDNSDKNPLNPFNPPRRITFGEQTTNEMCFVFLGGTSNQPILGRRGLPVTPFGPNKEAAAK